MTTQTRRDEQAASEVPKPSSGSRRTEPSWPLALASVGICLGTATAIVLIATLRLAAPGARRHSLRALR
jgi:hypothetical protein